eukprot:15824670-Heterocapsa_arctica.AAC.1
MYIEIPEEGAKLHIVKKYKHLGSMTCADNSSMAYARARAQSALTAYAPLAFRLFGCERLSISFRMSFVRSLILSRLTFNAH